MKNKDQNLLRALLDGELPDESGRFGSFGGQYAPETLMPALKKLEKNINSQRDNLFNLKHLIHIKNNLLLNHQGGY